MKKIETGQYDKKTFRNLVDDLNLQINKLERYCTHSIEDIRITFNTLFAEVKEAEGHDSEEEKFMERAEQNENSFGDNELSLRPKRSMCPAELSPLMMPSPGVSQFTGYLGESIGPVKRRRSDSQLQKYNSSK